MGKARAYAFFALLVALVGFGMARALTLRDEHNTANRSANAILEAWASTTEQYTRRTFETADLIFAMVSDRVRSDGGVHEAGRDPETQKILSNLARQTVGDYLMLVDDRGRPVALSATSTPPDVDLSDRDWFQAHKIRKIERYVGPSINSRITNDILFTYSRPVVDEDGRFLGALQSSMKQSFFAGVPMSRAMQRSAEIALWSLDGNLIGASSMTQEQVRKGFVSAEMREAVQRGGDGVLQLASLDTQRRAAFRVLPEWGIAVTASIPEDDVLNQWRKDRRNAVVTYAILALVLCALGAFAFLNAAREEKLARGIREKNLALEDAVAARELLIREVHHRVKNNLQVVSSLLRINSRRTSDVKTLVTTTQERIQAMATMHEVIYEGAVSADADLDAYLARLIGSIDSANALRSRGVSIHIDCEPARIAMDRLTPVGLIVVEVLSNATKHGFPDGRDGRLRITGRRAGGKVSIEIRNDGAPLEDAHRPSWGGRLIDALAGQIRGEHRLSREEEWTVFSLTFDEEATTAPAYAGKV